MIKKEVFSFKKNILVFVHFYFQMIRTPCILYETFGHAGFVCSWFLSIYLWSGGIAIKAAWFLYRVDDIYYRTVSP